MTDKAKETPAAPTEAAVIEKVQKGEKLNDQERELFKGIPQGGIPGITAPVPAKEEAPEDDIEDGPADNEDEQDPGKAAKEDEGEEEAGEEGSEGEEEAPEAGKAKKEAKPGEITEDRKQEILAEANKPDHLVNLGRLKMTPIELGLYWDLRKARKRNDKLQEENETLRIEKIVKSLKEKEEPAKKEGEEEDPLAGKDDEDVLTVADVRKLLAKTAKKEEPKGDAPLRSNEQIRLEKIEADNKLRAQGIEDFNDVVDFAGQVLGKDEEAIAILRDTAKSGGNVAEKTYWLIKGHPAWPEVEKVINEEKGRKGKKEEPKKEPPKTNVERAERIEKNDKKIKTTGTGSATTDRSKEYTHSEIAAMTADDIRRLPKETRQAILRKYGSTPNMSV